MVQRHREGEQGERAQTVLLCAPGTSLVGIPAAAVVEVLPAAELEAPDGAGAGWLTCRHGTIGVVDGSRLWTGRESAPRRNTRIVVLHDGPRPFGLLVERVLGVERVERADAAGPWRCRRGVVRVLEGDDLRQIADHVAERVGEGR